MLEQWKTKFIFYKPDDAFNKSHVEDDIMMDLFMMNGMKSENFDEAGDKCQTHQGRKNATTYTGHSVIPDKTAFVTNIHRVIVWWCRPRIVVPERKVIHAAHSQMLPFSQILTTTINF